MSEHRRHAEASSSSIPTFSILPSPHLSRWRNSQPSPQVSRLPRPAEHVFSSPDQVTLRSSIHPQRSSSSNSAAPLSSKAAPSQQMMNSIQVIGRWIKGRQNMERHPPPVSPNTFLPNAFATQSVTCAILVGWDPFCHWGSSDVSSWGRFWTLTAELWIFFQGPEELKENSFETTYTG